MVGAHLSCSRCQSVGSCTTTSPAPSALTVLLLIIFSPPPPTTTKGREKETILSLQSKAGLLVADAAPGV